MSKFPEFSASARQGELGTLLVAQLFYQKFGWIFRRTHQEQDFGIDGYVDIVSENGSVTGKFFAVQIKCGKSYFKHSTNTGYWYIGEIKHLNYLLNHPVPSIIILVNPETNNYLWCEFDANQTEAYGSSQWRMKVLKTQKLSKQAKPKLKALVGDAEDYTEELNAYWQTNKMLENSGLIILSIPRNYVEKHNLDYTTRFFDRLFKNNSLLHKCRGKIEIGVFGYEDDLRELYEIEEVRAYFKHIEPLVKYWFYFLTTHPESHSLLLLFTCTCNITASRGNSKMKIEFDGEGLADFFSRNFVWLNQMTEELGIISIDENETISVAIFEYFRYILDEQSTD